MPTAQELKKVWEALDAQIAAVEQEEQEAEEARLRAKEEAQVATEEAHLEEEEHEQEHALEQVRLAEEAQAQAEEEARMREEEERDTVEWDLHKAGGSSKEKACYILCKTGTLTHTFPRPKLLLKPSTEYPTLPQP